MWHSGSPLSIYIRHWNPSLRNYFYVYNSHFFFFSLKWEGISLLLIQSSCCFKKLYFSFPHPQKNIYFFLHQRICTYIYIGENVTSHRGCRVYSRAVPETIDQASHSISSPFFFFLYWINFDFFFSSPSSSKETNLKNSFLFYAPPPFF